MAIWQPGSRIWELRSPPYLRWCRNAASITVSTGLHSDRLRSIKLEDLQPHAQVVGITPEGPVTIVATKWLGSHAIEVTCRLPTGGNATSILYRSDEPGLEPIAQPRPWAFDADGALFRLVSEAHRIRLAHLFDPLLAVHTSLVEPLPHQITAVYESMLPRQLGDCRPTSSRSRFNVLLYGGTGVDARLNERLGATLGVHYGLSVRGFTGSDYLLRVLSLRAGLVYRIP